MTTPVDEPLSPTAMFHLAAATLERGVELHSLTEDEIRVLVSSTTTHLVDTVTTLRADLDAAREALKPFAAMGRLIESGFAEALFKDHEQIKLLPWTENGQTLGIIYLTESSI